ncbi:MAG: hypothetical protein LBL15_05025, partial [Oscillospiraceae bacterium]|nr:hypothetical protein [Oscillospiraceae bacterium]
MTTKQKLTLYEGLTDAESRADKFRALMNTGLSWNKVMDSFDQYAALEADEAMKATEKATALAKWADKQGYTDKQKAAVKDQLKFFTIAPADAARNDALTGAGLTAEDAYTLTEAFRKLTPQEGHENV